MKGSIYQITNEDESIVYIGSTTETIERRWSKHKAIYKRWLQGKAGGYSIFYHFKEHGIEQFSISLISQHEIDDRKQLLEFEQLTIDRTENVCNTQIAYRSEEQKLEKLEQKREYNREYNRSNRDAISAKRSVKCDCECGGKYTLRDKAKHKKTKKHQNWLSSQ